MSNKKIVKTIKKMIKFFNKNPDYIDMSTLDGCAFGKCFLGNYHNINWDNFKKELEKRTGLNYCLTDFYDIFDYSSVLARRYKPMTCENLFLDLISCDEYTCNHAISPDIWIHNAHVVLAKIDEYNLVEKE